jgi:hypothetical protein
MANEAATAEATAASPPPGDRSTHFVFEHKLFAVKGAYFRISHATDEPVLHVDLGDLSASLTINTLAKEFGLRPDTDDGKLLIQVQKGLRFVKEIRPGDSIPREILDGTASWTILPEHHAIARARLTVNLANWITGADSNVSDVHLLQRIADDPETKEKVNKALGEMAEKLGFGRDKKEMVLEKIEDLARELAYIEALRDRFGKVKMIERKVSDAAKLYRRERAIIEDIARVQLLLATPVKDLTGMFQMIDAQSGEVLAVMRKLKEQIKFIRSMRDDIHHKLMRWDETIDKWDPVVAERGEAMEAVLRSTYRFLARYFPQRSDWTLTVR